MMNSPLLLTSSKLFLDADWSIQLKLQPFLSKICRRLSVEEPYVALPSSLVELFSGLDGVIAAGISSETDTEKWTALMVACKSTAHIHDTVVKVSRIC